MRNSSNSKTATTKTFGPYTPMRQVGECYFISGHTGVDVAAGTASEDVAEQTAQALRNLATTLSTVGMELDDIVKTTLYLTDMGDFATVNEVYAEFFSEPRPARTTVGVKELPRVAGNTPLKIEIEAIAKAPCR
jgi:2-iminobutanoate/2-iminopropanoate deaminase